MANVLADLAVESEAATLVTFRLAGATDRAAAGDAQEAAFRRLALAATKYWVCKRAPAHAAEALECFGGNGYVEESGMPRLYREAPLQSIWEGSGNVSALDALRALARQPESADAFFAEVDQAAGADRRLDAAITRLRAELRDPAQAAARPAASPSTWPSCCRAPCWSVTAIRPWPTRSRCPGWAATGAARSARCRPAPTRARSSSGSPRNAPS